MHFLNPVAENGSLLSSPAERQKIDLEDPVGGEVICVILHMLDERDSNICLH